MEKDMLCMKLGSILDSAIHDFEKESDGLDIGELGAAADVIKDIAEAKKLVLEACYYETVIEAMKEEGSYGYTPDYRHMRSMKPMVDQMPYVQDYLSNPDDYMHRMGYSSPSHMNGNNTNRYGSAFQNYRTAKRHYTQSHDHADKEEMSQQTRDHVLDTMATMKEMWQDAEPGLRTEMREKLQQLLNELK